MQAITARGAPLPNARSSRRQQGHHLPAAAASRALAPSLCRRRRTVCASSRAPPPQQPERRTCGVSSSLQSPPPVSSIGLAPQAEDAPVKASSSDDGGASSSSWPLAGALALALLLPLAHPAAAADASSMGGHSTQYWVYVGLGAAGVVTTLLFTSRFLMSFFPKLEKEAKQRHSAAVYRALTAADPWLLDPITKGLFKQTEQGDLNYGAMALLSLVAAVMAVLLGRDGVLVEHVPDLTMLAALQYIVFFQHMMLLPMWTVVVFRYLMVI